MAAACDPAVAADRRGRLRRRPRRDRPRGRQPAPVVYAAVFAAFGAQVGFAWLLRGFFERWFEDRLDERAQARIVRTTAIAALVLVVLAVLPPTRPVGVAAIGGMTVGLMFANVSAVRRARRGG